MPRTLRLNNHIKDRGAGCFYFAWEGQKRVTCLVLSNLYYSGLMSFIKC